MYVNGLNLSTFLIVLWPLWSTEVLFITDLQFESEEQQLLLYYLKKTAFLMFFFQFFGECDILNFCFTL